MSASGEAIRLRRLSVRGEHTGVWQKARRAFTAVWRFSLARRRLREQMFGATLTRRVRGVVERKGGAVFSACLVELLFFHIFCIKRCCCRQRLRDSPAFKRAPFVHTETESERLFGRISKARRRRNADSRLPGLRRQRLLAKRYFGGATSRVLSCGQCWW